MSGVDIVICSIPILVIAFVIYFVIRFTNYYVKLIRRLIANNDKRGLRRLVFRTAICIGVLILIAILFKWIAVAAIAGMMLLLSEKSQKIHY